MKNAFLVLLMALGFFAAADRSAADWIQATDIEGGTVLSLAAVGTTLFAGTENCGVYVSADLGEHWAPSGLPGLTIRAMAAREGELFAGTNDGVFHSTDGGVTWNPAGLTGKTILALAAAGSNLVAGIANGGVALSTDDGMNWTAAGLTGLTVMSFFVSGDRIVALMFYGTAVSTDGGITWGNIQVAQKIFSSNAVKDQTLFAGTSAGVLATADGGDTWFKAGLTGKQVGALGVAGPYLFAAVVNEGVYVSTQSDTNWTQMNEGLTHLSISSFIRIGDKLFAGSYGGGVFRSTGPGTTWTGVNRGMDCIHFISLAAGAGAVCVAGTDHAGVFITQDGGLTWMPAGLTGLSVNALLVQGRNIHAGTSDGLFRSGNYGATWDTVGQAGNSIAAMAFQDQNIIVQLSYFGTRYSTNHGRDWTSIGLSFNAFIYAGANLLGGASNGIRLSTDHGATWGLPMLEGRDIKTMALIGQDVFAGTSTGLYGSTDKGLTWAPKGFISGWSLNESHILFNAIAGSDTSLFAGTDRNGVLHSTDNGATWSEVNKGLSLLTVEALAVGTSDIFAAGAGGLWRRRLSDISTAVDESPGQAQVNFRLGQNYPNPFNSTTRFDFQIKEREMVTLKVFDILGREAATVVSEVLPAGCHSAAWNAGALSSGVYTYRLRAGESVETKKLLLTK